VVFTDKINPLLKLWSEEFGEEEKRIFFRELTDKTDHVIIRVSGLKKQGYVDEVHSLRVLPQAQAGGPDFF
jgi:hypothetical protein